MSKETYYQKNRETKLNRSKEYYDKEKLKEQGKNKCRDLSEKEKDMKREYGRNRCRELSEKEKDMKRECGRNR